MSPAGYVSRFAAIEGAPDRLVKKLMPRFVDLVLIRASENAPKRSGKLAGSGEGLQDRGGLRGIMRFRARHAHLIHEGTEAHAIRPRKGHKAITIPTGGGMVIRRSAYVRGVKANPFLDRALEQSKGTIASTLRTAEHALAEALGGLR